jgi:hypothetical protein
MIDPLQPTRSAITVAGIQGHCAKIARTRAPDGDGRRQRRHRARSGRALLDPSLTACMAAPLGAGFASRRAEVEELPNFHPHYRIDSRS